ncbi:hypothetical protein ACJZ2D_006617 [Fusarium nematophilum]
MTMGQLRGWGSMAAPRIGLDVPLMYLIASSLMTSLGIASAALWVGAMTPVESITTTDASFDIPAYSNTSLIVEYPSEAEPEAEPFGASGLYARWSVQLLGGNQIVSNDLTNLYVSVLGDALLSSVAAWDASNNPDGTASEAEAMLAGVENALVAMADDMVPLYGAAQLMVGNFSQSTAASVAVSVMAIGKWQYAVAVAVVNAVVVFAALAEIVRTRGWRYLPAFDYTDLTWLLLASFRGGTINAGTSREVMGGEDTGATSKGERGSLLRVQELEEGVETVEKETKDIDIGLKELEDRDRNIALIIRGC